jgi:uncharacterized membrane protein
MAPLGSNKICALTLAFIALTDIFIALDIPILRQVFGFALLTFLPGFLILRILRFGKNSLEKTLFLIGLSVSFLFFVPLVMNFVYPLTGISRPISLSPLVITFSLILAGLSLAAYKKGSLDLQINAGGFKKLIDKIMAPPVLGAALIVVIGILGGLSMMFYLDSIFSLLLGLSVVLAVILIISGKVSPRFYPLYILVIAVALQYSRTLASPNLFGTDAMYELYFANLVKVGGIWNPSFSVLNLNISDYYAMLSVAILPNVYSILLNLSTVWVFKLIYPFIFAFVPLGLYEIFRTQVKFSNKSAFLAVFLFMSYFAFFEAMPIITREEIAGLFFVLAALLIMNRYPQASKKTALLIVFIGSMVVSHYATSYLFLFYLGVVCVGSAFVTSRTRQKSTEPAIPVSFVVLVIVVTFGWYMLAGAGTPYIGLLGVGTHTFNTLSTEMFATSTNPSVQAALTVSTAGLSLINSLQHYWQAITEVLILTGLVSVIWRRKTPKMSPQFFMFSLASLSLLLVIIALPSLGGVINSWRVYSIALLFLAPCYIFGIEVVVETISGWLGANRSLVLKLTSVALIVLLVPYFLLNYGFISEIAEHPTNYAFLPTQNLSGRGVEYSDNATWSYMIEGPVPTESVYAGTWISGATGQSPVYADWLTAPELAGYGNVSPNSIIVFSNATLQYISSNEYIYLGPANVQQQSIGVLSGPSTNEINISSVPALAAASRVYDSGLVEVYRTQ